MSGRPFFSVLNWSTTVGEQIDEFSDGQHKVDRAATPKLFINNRRLHCEPKRDRLVQRVLKPNRPDGLWQHKKVRRFYDPAA